MLKFCANRIMALQELQALGRMAAGFERSGCYACPGTKTECSYFTPLAWVYDSNGEIPEAIRAFIRESISEDGPGDDG
ncbi:MAG: hypothetical protein ACYTFG_14990 [Planctomycetota bacterium]|jgi:hypothetical protein